MPVDIFGPALIAKGAGLNGATSFLDPLGNPLGGLMAMTPLGMAANVAGGLAQQAAQGAAQGGGVIEQSLYLLPLLPALFRNSGRHIRPGESRTIRLSTHDRRGARYAEFL